MNKIAIPVAIEQTLYSNIGLPYMRTNKKPHKVKVCFIGLNKNGGFFNVVYNNDNMFQFNFLDVGTHVFYTQEQALRALEKEVKQ